MAQIPKIPQSAIARLRAGAPGASGTMGAAHPDANLLSAFSENSLEKRDRAEVMEHLAGCPQCRDVLALQALAATQTGEEGSPSPFQAPKRVRGWLSKTELRWAAVAASLAIVAGMVLLRPPERVSQERTESSSAAAPPQQSPVAKTHVEASAEKKVETAKQDKKRRDAVAEDEISRNAPARAAAARTMPTPAPAATAETAAPAATANLNFEREILKDNKVAAPAAPAPAAMAKEKNSTAAASASTVPANSYDSMTANQSPPPTATPLEGQNAGRAAEVRKPMSGMQTANTITTSAADSVGSEPASGLRRSGTIAGALGSVAVSKLPSRVPPPGERWRVEQGILQVSENSGQTWNTVSPGRGPGGHPGLISVTRGQEVWAGDSQGGLSHSLDNGDHWQRVLYGGTENIAGATIVSIFIPNPGQMIIRNSAGASWISRDGGKTWRTK